MSLVNKVYNVFSLIRMKYTLFLHTENYSILFYEVNKRASNSLFKFYLIKFS